MIKKIPANEEGAPTPLGRSSARLAAVQALYQIELTGTLADDVIGQFVSGRRPAAEEGECDYGGLEPPDPTLFGSIVRGVILKRKQLDEMISGSLSENRNLTRLDILVRLILEAGVYEITERAEVPPRVAINEYLNVAHAFFEGPETSFINGVLDAVARAYRTDEMSGTRP